LALFVPAFIPMIMGFIWYHEKSFGKAWAAGAGMTEEKMKSGIMPLLFGIAFLFSLQLALAMNFQAVHDPQVLGATHCYRWHYEARI